MSRYSRRIDNMLKRNRGTVTGQPRIYNVDDATYTLGYTEANTDATTAFSRVKTAKGIWSGTSDISEGDLIQDRFDDKFYLVMAIKGEVSGGEIAYVDATLLVAHAVCSIQRFTDGTKDAFGWEADPAASNVATGVRCCFSSMSIDMIEQEDASIPKNKIKVYLQSKHGIQENDRLLTAGGNTYRVVSMAEEELNGLILVYVDKDLR